MGIGFYELIDGTRKELPSNLQVIDKDTIKSKEKLLKVYIPSSVVAILDDSFSECENLKYVEFEEGSSLRYIGNFAFYSCVNLKEFDFSALSELRMIDNSAFSNTGLRIVDFSENDYLACINVGSFSGNNDLRCVIFNEKAGSFGISVIPKGCFDGCEKLVSVEGTGNIVYISDAFYGCPLINIEDIRLKGSEI